MTVSTIVYFLAVGAAFAISVYFILQKDEEETQEDLPPIARCKAKSKKRGTLQLRKDRAA